MTIDDKRNSLASMRRMLETSEDILVALEADPSRRAAAAELRDAIVMLKAEIAEWSANVDAECEQRARVAAALAASPRPMRCSCGARTSNRRVGNIEDVLALIVAEERDEAIADVVRELTALCSACFASQVRGLRAFAAARRQARRAETP